MTTTNKKATLKASDLFQFYGTEHYWQVSLLHPFLLTDGVKYLVDHAEAYWLVDAIASWQMEKQVKGDSMLQEFQLWTLTVAENRSAVLRCERDQNDAVVTQRIEYTDFPLSEVGLYLCNIRFFWAYQPQDGKRPVQGYGVIMLPSEY